MAHHADILTVEIGSTYTKAAAYVMRNGALRFGGRAAVRTTIEQGDVALGYREVLGALRRDHHLTSFGQIYLSSSAAGGLRIVVCGLTFNLTTKAALESALGAGGVVLKSFAGSIVGAKACEIARLNPNLVLLCGGLDFGEEAAVMANAEALATSPLAAVVVYAGNSALREEVAMVFKQAGKTCIIAENVYPNVDDFRFRAVQNIIRSVFETEVVKAPGVAEIQRETALAIPTPLAVSYAVEHIARQYGDVVALDVGGATTDVHSYLRPRQDGDQIQATVEPPLKRSVEGDVGVFHNIQHLFESESDRFELASPTDPRLDLAHYTRRACHIGLLRHCGSKTRAHLGAKMVDVIYGRDLSSVEVIVGTGGGIVYGARDASGFKQMCADLPAHDLLPRSGTRFLIDRQYLLSSIGLFANEHPAAVSELLHELFAQAEA